MEAAGGRHRVPREDAVVDGPGLRVVVPRHLDRLVVERLQDLEVRGDLLGRGRRQVIRVHWLSWWWTHSGAFRSAAPPPPHAEPRPAGGDDSDASSRTTSSRTLRSRSV